MLEAAEAAAAELRMPVSRASSLTVDHLVVENSERQQLRDKYGVGSVNMEDHAVAVAVGKSGVPFISVQGNPGHGGTEAAGVPAGTVKKTQRCPHRDLAETLAHSNPVETEIPDGPVSSGADPVRTVLS